MAMAYRLSWVEGWVGSWVHIFTMAWIGLGWIGHFVGWVEEIGPTNNSDSDQNDPDIQSATKI